MDKIALAAESGRKCGRAMKVRDYALFNFEKSWFTRFKQINAQDADEARRLQAAWDEGYRGAR